ncbi:DedA family protein [Arthrobacter sp. NyZ413]|uniref:DedA family protein n=1 Tax=Arthrobacter sp. NyZ413 TaxID=3144669 RepID=UPI002C67D4C0|nr:VTT domain-containing protein [Arthrobacter sp.]
MFDPTTLLQGLGPAALGIVALIVFIESGLLFPFLPGDSLLFTAGLLHQQLQVGLPVLIAIVSVAAVAGDQVGYLLGRRFGRRWFKDDAKVMKTAHLQAAEDFFARRGGPAIVLARFVPVVRTFAPLAAGAARYGYKSFTLWNIAGALVWGTSVTLLGAWLGHFEFVAKNIDVIAVILVLASVLPWGVEFLKRRKAAATAAADPEDNTVNAMDGRAGE